MKKTTFTSLLLLLCIHFSFIIIPSEPYSLDQGHTYIGFDVERFLVGEVSGRFNEFSADVSMKDNDYTTLQLDATIKVASIDSNNKTRDGHLKGEIWLDEANHPTIRFTSTSVSKNEYGKYIMTGNFTIKGITNTVTFPIVISGPFKDPTQKTAIGIKADFVINRFDYGINLDKKLRNGSFFIGKDVKIKIRALAYKN
ncbi:YceI family protein [Flavobacteriaceae bacterium S356]|uniref:YceI family protein n=1 Tax=Asprobacillus argus TaxID=3076534 RepID=A0ABU3LFD7_9FLAO|nr:YceI family protein [Flavobacteriaceae bacterium S356]